MRIILIRHGRPAIKTKTKIAPMEINYWLNHYSRVNVDEKSTPSKEAIKIASMCNYTVCSNTIRSIQSAKMLEIENNIKIVEELSEISIPYVKWKKPKLQLRIWGFVFCILWFLGFSENCESKSDAKLRAKKAAGKLINLASIHNDVIFVGHGIFNFLVSRMLKQNGWKGPIFPSGNFWKYGIYKK